jgi:hypothetical protein
VNRFVVSTLRGPGTPSEQVTSDGLRLRWTPDEGAVGAFVSLVGSGFGRGRPVRVVLGRTTVASPRTDRKGRFSARFGVPALPTRTATVRVRARRTDLAFRFSVVTDPVIAAAGDIACDRRDPRFNGGSGTVDACHQKQTSDAVIGIDPDAVLLLGDIQYEGGVLPNYLASFDPTWGRFKKIIWPTMGNHESGGAPDYFRYFGPIAGSIDKAYYSFDVGGWRIIALNSNYEDCAATRAPCHVAGVQRAWLQADLAAHANRCVLAYFHYPRFSSGIHGNYTSVQPLWELLHAAGADVVLNGHDHDYERFAPQTPVGTADPNGIRQFVVGSGGRDFRDFRPAQPNSEARNNQTFGVLKLTLHSTSFDWEFVPEAGGTFRDSGSGACH